MASEMVKLLDGATTTTALAIKAGATALPTKADGYRSLAGRNVRAVRLKFGGTAAANKTCDYQIYLWRRRGDLVTAATATLYDPEEVARGVAILGAKAYTDGGAAHYEADIITNTITACPNVYVHSRGDDRSAWIYVDCPDVLGIQVIIDLEGASAAATADVWIQELSEADSLPFVANGLGEYYTESTITMVAGAGNTGYSGAGGAGQTHKALIVTGVVRYEIVTECVADLTGNTATYTAGTADDVYSVSGLADLIIATTIDENELVPVNGLDAPKASYAEVPGDTDCVARGVSNGKDIIYTVGVADLTGGTLRWHCRWWPREPGANVAPGVGD